ncbi:MAG: hypothetical protein IJI35_02290 [Kiritimatiellae bacterium]|nr:hypothetical protein [Kiritimatiellia bacterium]
MRKWRAAHPDSKREADRRYRAKNREKIRARRHRHYVRNRKKILAKTREYHKSHGEERRAKARDYYARNIDSCRAKSRAYRAKNREQLNRYARKFYAEHRKDILRKLRVYRAANRTRLNARWRELYPRWRKAKLAYGKIWRERDKLRMLEDFDYYAHRRTQIAAAREHRRERENLKRRIAYHTDPAVRARQKKSKRRWRRKMNERASVDPEFYAFIRAVSRMEYIRSRRRKGKKYRAMPYKRIMDWAVKKQKLADYNSLMLPENVTAGMKKWLMDRRLERRKFEADNNEV